jgi:NAD(P)-dependent dehydrogenase (short-subunit alcohol dehydrogenase family)
MRTALVAGANRGIGRVVADRLSGLGHRVVVTVRRQADADDVAAELGSPAVGVALEVTDAESVRQAHKAVGYVDILVNNAAIVLDDGVLIMSMAPVHCRSTPEEAAIAIAEVATLPDDGPTGVFFRDGRPIDW